jgi:16S rRNA G966 N2-methylase RsmD
MKLINADSSVALQDIPENSIDAVITDPPYNLIKHIKWDLLPSTDVFKRIYKVMKPGAPALIMTSSRQDLYTEAILRIREAGFNISYSSMFWIYNTTPVKGRINWEKGYIEGFNPRNAVEIIITALKPVEGTVRDNIGKYGLPVINFAEATIKAGTGDNLPSNLLLDSTMAVEQVQPPISQSTYNLHAIENWVFDIPKPSRSELFFIDRKPRDRYSGMFYGSRKDLDSKENHMTVKPIKLFSYLISMVTQKGMTILDPFAGTGTAMISAYLTGRDCIAIEFNPNYITLALKRLEAYGITHDLIIY